MTEWKKKGKGQQKLEEPPKKYMVRKSPRWKAPLLLHEKYKKYKVGLLTEEDLTDEEIMLMQKYYGL